MIQIDGNTIKIRQATNKGYVEIPLERERESKWVADLSYPKSKLRRGRCQGDPPGTISPTVTTTGGLYVLEEVNRRRLKIRKMTPKEAMILMGLTAEDYDKCKAMGISDSQLYKISGNGLISYTVQYIVEHLYKALGDNSYETTDERMQRLGYGV